MFALYCIYFPLLKNMSKKIKNYTMFTFTCHLLIFGRGPPITLFSGAISVGYWLTKQQNKPSSVSTEFYREFNKCVNSVFANSPPSQQFPF